MNTQTTLPVQESGIRLFLILLGLTGFAISAPLLSNFGNHPEIFLFYNVDSHSRLILFVIAIAVVPAAVLWIALVSVRTFFPIAYGPLRMMLAFSLSAFWAIQFFSWELDIESALLSSGLACAFGMLAVLALLRWGPVRSFLQISALLPAIAAGNFLFASEAAKLTEQEETALEKPATANNLPSILFIMLDEISTLALFDEDYNVDKLRYPNLWALSQESTWYTHYTVLADRTLFSVPSILSGKKPSGAVATSKRYPNNLFSMLLKTHHLTAFEAVTGLCSYKECSEAGPGEVHRAEPKLSALLQVALDLWLQRLSPWASNEPQMDDFQEQLVEVSGNKPKPKNNLLAHLLAPETLVNYTQAKPKRVERFKETFRPSTKPALYFLHLELPHVPWRFYEDGTLYDAPTNTLAITASKNGPSEWMARVAEYRFTMQAEHTDRIVGELFEKLKSQGMWDDMLVVVTADHGRSFRPNTNARIMSLKTASSVAYVPLFIKRPGQKNAAKDTTNLMAHDLLPTIAESIQLELPWPVDGLAANDPKISARGDAKFARPKKETNSFKTKMDRKLTFSVSQTYPSLTERFIKPKKNEDDPLSALNNFLGLNQFLGRKTAEFVIKQGDNAHVENLERLRKPGNAYPMGMVMGSLPFATSAKHVLVAINGVLLTGSEIFAHAGNPRSFLAMLPRGSLQPENTVQIFLVEGDHLIELALN